MSLQQIAVIGSGQMGQGIAQVAAAQAQAQVWLYDANQQATVVALDKIAASLNKLESKGKIAAGVAKASLSRIQVAQSLTALKDCDFIIEAIVEKEAVKTELFRQLDALVKPSAILASNTSSIPIAILAQATQRADQVIGMHFMNPVPLMTLVEIIRGPRTSEATYTATQKLAVSMGKETVCSRDFPGFIVNRILMPMLNEAFYVLHESLAAAADIDKAMKLGTNQPMGPLALADYIGLDTCLFILEVLHRDLGDPKYRPCPLLRQYVQAGMLGVKSQRGVYSYA